MEEICVFPIDCHKTTENILNPTLKATFGKKATRCTMI